MRQGGWLHPGLFAVYVYRRGAQKEGEVKEHVNGDKQIMNN